MGIEEGGKEGEVLGGVWDGARVPNKGQALAL